MSKVDIPTKEEISKARAEALAAIEAMRFADGVEWELDRHRHVSLPYRYIRVKGQPKETPLMAWARQAWVEGRRVEVKADGWLGAAQFLGLSRAAAHMIQAAADDFPLKDREVRAALMAKVGLREATA